MITQWNHLSGEERANTLTHFVAFLATCIAAPFLMQAAMRSSLSKPLYDIAGTALFIIGMGLMYASSTVYHATTDPIRKARLRILDHIAIFVMIAGSYSLLCLSVVGGVLGKGIFIFLWMCVFAGFIGKIYALGKHPKLSLALYLAMGWVALLMIVPMWRHLSLSAFLWILGEGVAYTVGAYFFNNDEEHAYYHAVWHLFIILGSACHTVATFLILC
jgi:hemolysin III